MHSEYCVDTTTRRALALEFPVVLMPDAHTSAGNEAITAAQVIAHHNGLDFADAMTVFEGTTIEVEDTRKDYGER